VAELPAPLRPLAARPEQGALFLDFDGTLAPIVDDPAEARPLPGVAAALGALGDRFGLVAVVSGRPGSFLVERLGAPAGLVLVGLYGLEEVVDGQVRPASEAEPWRPVVADVTAAARAEAPSGVGVEDKGLSVTVHWRNRPDAEGWATRFVEAATTRTGLVAQPGRMALELRPPLAADKGTVVTRLGQGWEAAACFGDDLGDLPAFRALDHLAAAGASVARVAVVDAESPPEVAAAADVTVDGPAGALALLEGLVAGS